MSNRVVCREASHAGSWYTASGRAPGRPAGPSAAAAWPRARPAEVGGPAPRGGGRDEVADGRRPRTAWGGSGPEAGLAAFPPARHPAGQPGVGRPHALPGVGREGELPPRQPAPSLRTRLEERMRSLTEPTCRLLRLPGSGRPAAATPRGDGSPCARALLPPCGAERPSALPPREGRAFLLSPPLPSPPLPSPLFASPPHDAPSGARDPGSS